MSAWCLVNNLNWFHWSIVFGISITLVKNLDGIEDGHHTSINMWIMAGHGWYFLYKSRVLLNFNICIFPQILTLFLINLGAWSWVFGVRTITLIVFSGFYDIWYICHLAQDLQWDWMWASYNIKYVYNGWSCDFGIFGIPEIIFSVRAFKLGMLRNLKGILVYVSFASRSFMGLNTLVDFNGVCREYIQNVGILDNSSLNLFLSLFHDFNYFDVYAVQNMVKGNGSCFKDFIYQDFYNIIDNLTFWQKYLSKQKLVIAVKKKWWTWVLTDIVYIMLGFG